MSVHSGYSANSSGALSDDETAYDGDGGYDAASVSTMDRTVSTLEPITGAAGDAQAFVHLQSCLDIKASVCYIAKWCSVLLAARKPACV